MKIKLTIFFAALISIGFPNLALSQNKPLACQEDAVAGLNWENGRWVTSRFIENKFILIQQGENLTNESVAKAINNAYPNQVICKNVNPQISCSDQTGTLIYFNPSNLKGGIARVFGSAMSGDKKDTVAVSAFSCAAF
jgi:hypothetical protein